MITFMSRLPNKKLLFIAILALPFLAVGCNQAQAPTIVYPSTNDSVNTNQGPKAETELEYPYVTPIQVGREKLFVEVVTTEPAYERGLSNRPTLKGNQGMLFDFRHEGAQRPGFWMKDMLFNLDLIWIKNGLVVDITKNALAPEVNTKLNELPLYKPNSDIDMVLEVNSGWTDKNNIRIGDQLTY
jgi:uncharacterized membrane protein (UPF0127 family)